LVKTIASYCGGKLSMSGLPKVILLRLIKELNYAPISFKKELDKYVIQALLKDRAVKKTRGSWLARDSLEIGSLLARSLMNRAVNKPAR
jgi:hypothetical protein